MTACPACRAPVDPGMRFCGQCGARVEEAPAAVAERRHLTVMFCDLVGSTQLSARLDPEDLREVLREYHDAATRAIRLFEGHVAEYLGDGLVVYFGYPNAHEDDAERAVRAGLAVVRNMEELNAQLAGRLAVHLAVRVGIHTGLVVVGEVGARDVRDVIRIVGETPNIAARVQGEAPVDAVAVTSTTAALLGPRLRLESLGARELKGVAAPLEVFRVVGEGVVAARSFEATVPIVDRTGPLAHLLERWNEVRAGAGRVVTVVGGAGIGKSKLLDALRSACAADAAWMDGACSPYSAATPLHPFTEMLAAGLPAGGDDPYADLEAALAAHGLADEADLVAPLLGIAVPGPPRRLGVSPAIVRRATHDAILTLLRRLAGSRPVVLAVEDVQWADPSTAELLDGVRRRPVDGVLVVCTSREPAGGEAEPAGASVVRLDPLDRADAEVLVERVAGAPLAPELVAALADRADGVPLFATELVRTLVETDALQGEGGELVLRRPIDETLIPGRLQDSLMARIDRLGPAKPLAQWAAVLGRTFRADVLRAVAGSEAPDLAGALRRLLELQVVEVVGAEDGGGQEPTDVLAFTHALLRDVAYGSMLRSTRRERHLRVATVLQDRFGDLAGRQPEVVARHLTEAGAAADAVAWWRRVADAATRRSAVDEAVVALRRARGLLDQVEESPGRAPVCLAVHAALGAALAAGKGYADEETAGAYRAAQELARQVPAAPELFPVLFGLVAFLTARGEFPAARAAGDQLLSSAEAADDDGLRIEAAYSLGMVDLYTARFDAAVEHLRRGIALYDPDRHHPLAYRYVFDPGVGCHRSIGIPLCLTGRVDEALGHAQQALALAERLQHGFSHASALVFGAIVHQLAGRRDDVADLSAAAVTMAEALGYPFWASSGHVLHGWAVGGPGGRDEVRAAVARYEATGARVLLPYWLTLLAGAELDAGDGGAARAALARAEAVEAETGERCWSDARRSLLARV